MSLQIGLTPKVSGGFEKVTKEPEVACRFLEFDTEPLGDDPFGKLKP